MWPSCVGRVLGSDPMMRHAYCFMAISVTHPGVTRCIQVPTALRHWSLRWDCSSEGMSSGEGACCARGQCSQGWSQPKGQLEQQQESAPTALRADRGRGPAMGEGCGVVGLGVAAGWPPS